jgi:hypothetical protein
MRALIGDRHLRTFAKVVCREFNESCRFRSKGTWLVGLMLSNGCWHCQLQYKNQSQIAALQCPQTLLSLIELGFFVIFLALSGQKWPAIANNSLP